MEALAGAREDLENVEQGRAATVHLKKNLFFFFSFYFSHFWLFFITLEFSVEWSHRL